MTIEEDFTAKADQVKNLKSSPGNDDLLILYALYKQATVGDNNTDKPGMLDFKGKAKWEAWNGKKGVDKQTAMKEYIAKVDELISSIGLN